LHPESSFGLINGGLLVAWCARLLYARLLYARRTRWGRSASRRGSRGGRKSGRYRR
jgi:hypothetical protein